VLRRDMPAHDRRALSAQCGHDSSSASPTRPRVSRGACVAGPQRQLSGSSRFGCRWRAGKARSVRPRSAACPLRTAPCSPPTPAPHRVPPPLPTRKTTTRTTPAARRYAGRAGSGSGELQDRDQGSAGVSVLRIAF
jgi:hypothetical protein